MISAAGSDQRGFGVLSVLVLIAVILVLLGVALGAVSALRVRDARAGWDETLGPWEEIMRRYPATEANAAAIELERLAASLGVDITPRHVDRLRPTTEQSQAFAPLKEDVFSTYLYPQLEQVRRGEIAALPPVLTAYMQNHAGDLASLRSHLIGGPPPAWESDLSKLAAPLPNLLGHLDLTKLLISLAFTHLHEGDVAGALENVEASFELARSLRDSPILICQLIMIAETRMQLGVLRHVRDLPEAWIERMEAYDYRDAFLTSMKFEGRIWLHPEGYLSGDPGDSWLQKTLALPPMRSYTRLCLADVSAAWRARIVNLERVDAVCDRDLSSEGGDLNIPVPRWNAIGDLVVPNLSDAIYRLARLELDLELTRLIAEADANHGISGEAWLESPPVHRASTACPDDRWLYSADDGNLRIELSRQIAWPGQKGVILPTRAVLD
jgi:hypothetical protein